MKNIHILKVTYSPSSFTIRSFRFAKKKRVGFQYSERERTEQVLDALTNAGYTILGSDRWASDADYFIVKEFEWKWE